MSIESNQLNTCDVDHFVPLSTQFNSTHDLDLNGVWNLVLCCQDCNRGETNGKFARLPDEHLIQRLYKRNEYLIESNHPLKETIIMRTGKNQHQRANFLNTMYGFAKSLSRARWQPEFEYDIGF
ncbi:HNH endonuclease domain-containing protein [Sporosarcina sp. UB5]